MNQDAPRDLARDGASDDQADAYAPVFLCEGPIVHGDLFYPEGQEVQVERVLAASGPHEEYALLQLRDPSRAELWRTRHSDGASEQIWRIEAADDEEISVGALLADASGVSVLLSKGEAVGLYRSERGTVRWREFSGKVQLVAREEAGDVLLTSPVGGFSLYRGWWPAVSDGGDEVEFSTLGGLHEGALDGTITEHAQSARGWHAIVVATAGHPYTYSVRILDEALTEILAEFPIETPGRLARLDEESLLLAESSQAPHFFRITRAGLEAWGQMPPGFSVRSVAGRSAAGAIVLSSADGVAGFAGGTTGPSADRRVTAGLITGAAPGWAIAPQPALTGTCNDRPAISLAEVGGFAITSACASGFRTTQFCIHTP